MSDLLYAGVADTAALIKRREVSPVAVIEAHLDRIEQVNPQINAFVEVMAEEALEDARQKEGQLSKGATFGPLFGIPVAIKDGTPVAGVRDRSGSRAIAGTIAAADGLVAARLRRSGAVFIGKTNTSEFGFKGTTDNLLIGATSTPFRSGLNAGGSSGGSAAAVAAGMATVAHGTDGGGSIRIPASCCGVFGLKPTFGLVPTVSRPDAFGVTPFGGHGVLARSVEDAAVMLGEMVGPERRDPFAMPEGNSNYLATLRDGVRGKAIAFSANLGSFPVQAEIRETVRSAAAAFETGGAHVDEVPIEWGYRQKDLSASWLVMAQVSYAAMAASLASEGIDLLGTLSSNVSPGLVDLISAGKEIKAVDYVLNNIVRTAVLDVVESILDRYDYLICPVLCVDAVDNVQGGATAGPPLIGDDAAEPLIGWALTYPFNFTGHPVASIPAGLSTRGIPIGMQIVGRRLDEAGLLAACTYFESVHGWSHWFPVP